MDKPELLAVSRRPLRPADASGNECDRGGTPRELERKFRARLDRALKREQAAGLNILKLSLSDTFAKGYPDWLLFGSGFCVAAEIKRVGENPRPIQKQMLDRFARVGTSVGVIRPCGPGEYLFEWESWQPHERSVYRSFGELFGAL